MSDSRHLVAPEHRPICRRKIQRQRDTAKQVGTA